MDALVSGGSSRLQIPMFSMKKRVQATHRFLQASAFIAVFLVAAGATQGATVEAKSPALADVKSAIASAHEVDTVTVPAG